MEVLPMEPLPWPQPLAALLLLPLWLAADDVGVA